MQILSSHEVCSSVKKNFLNGYPDEVVHRYHKLELWQRLKYQKSLDVEVYNALEVSRPTIYRWKKKYKEEEFDGLRIISTKPHTIRKAVKQDAIRDQVLALRKKYPLFGKEKIKVMLKKEYGIDASVSTVGVVLTSLLEQRKILYVNDVCGKKRFTRKRQFNDHAQRFEYGMKAHELGEMIQLDHMTQAPFKHFAAICPISKLAFAYGYRQATALTSVDFLEKMLSFFPFKLSSIQVDGGSEFMADFEQACKKHAIKLFVLPPKSPKLNGCVERSNGTFNYEFYALYPRFRNIHDLNEKLAQFSRFYNEIRPHQRLNYLTPMEYLNNREAKKYGFRLKCI